MTSRNSDPDTSVVIATDVAPIPGILAISAITLAELSHRPRPRSLPVHPQPSRLGRARGWWRSGRPKRSAEGAHFA